jgi:putative SOS response-associated peptidase YedK
MCNLYSEIKGQQAIRDLFQIAPEDDFTGNLPPMPGIFPNYMAPIVRIGPADRRRIVMRRWGMPTPPERLKPGVIDTGTTNVRRTWLPHWRQWLGVENRCIVPATSFCEPTDDAGPDGKKIWTWFALDESRPLFAFAGIWCNWDGVRGTKAKPEEGTHQLFGFLTTAANAIVKPIHKKAMPAILTTAEEIDTWLTAPTKIALALQRPLPAEMLKIVAKGRKDDDGSAVSPSQGLLL